MMSFTLRHDQPITQKYAHTAPEPIRQNKSFVGEQLSQTIGACRNEFLLSEKAKVAEEIWIGIFQRIRPLGLDKAVKITDFFFAMTEEDMRVLLI